MSSELPPAPIPPPNDNAQGNGDDATCKEELQRDGVEDLTLDEETDEQPVVAHNDVVRSTCHTFIPLAYFVVVTPKWTLKEQ